LATKDLIDLVDAAHNYKKNGSSFPIRVILDVVINHSGDNWSYPGDTPIIIATISNAILDIGGILKLPFRRSCATRHTIIGKATSTAADGIARLKTRMGIFAALEILPMTTIQWDLRLSMRLLKSRFSWHITFPISRGMIALSLMRHFIPTEEI
jgi:hypothetical protein